MNLIDIIVVAALCYTAYKGYSNGLIVELTGTLSIIVGCFIAYRFSYILLPYLSMSKEVATVVSFILVLIGFVVLVNIIARMVSKMLSTTLFGSANRVLGTAVALLKALIVTSLILSSIIYLNSLVGWVSPTHFKESKACIYGEKSAVKIFPYISFLTDYYEQIKDVIIPDESNSN